MLAIRPRTLIAGAVPVGVGIAAASLEAPVDAAVALATLCAALLLQVASNLANDYYDFVAGVDTEERLGPVRVTQSGLLSAEAVKRGLAVVLVAALLFGGFLVVRGGIVILAIGVVSIVSALAYSAGPWPLSRYGFGEPMAFVFFGVVAVCGTYFLQVGAIDLLAVAASIPIGCLAAALISVNNLRDTRTDKAAGKRTIAVRWGEPVSRRLYVVLITTAYAGAVAFALSFHIGVLVVVLTVPFAVGECAGLYRREGAGLNESLAGTARLELFFGLAFLVGVLL
jgi:1,4-dihydroxy-2-naphthoate octaprenyltransferase